MKEDRLTYDELLKFNNHTIEDAKEFAKELRNRIDKQRIIIAGEPAFDSSEFEKVFQSAREEDCGIAIFKPSDNNHIEHVQNQEIFGINKDTVKKHEQQIILKELQKKKKTFKKEFGYVKRKFR